MASLYGRGAQYLLPDGRYFVPLMDSGNGANQFATDLGEKWLTADTWGSPLVKMDMPDWTNNVTRNGGGMQFNIGPMSHYAGEGYVSNTPFNTREAAKDVDPGMFSMENFQGLLGTLGPFLAAGAIGALSGAEGAAAGSTQASGGWIPDFAPGGGMDWWTELGLTPADVGMEVGQWTTNPSFTDLTGGMFNNAPLMPPADASGMNPNMVETGTPNWNPTVTPESNLLKQASQLLKMGWSGAEIAQALGISPSLLSGMANGGGLGGRSIFDTAVATAPVLAAIAYAKNQGPFDTSRLESTYNEFSPDALAFQYDQNTAAGRDALTTSLGNRGVMGSSFGNMDITNFNTTRDLGRRSLVNQGLAARGSMAGSILDAEIKSRALQNDLYGRSLLALGNVFGGRNQSPVYA